MRNLERSHEKNGFLFPWVVSMWQLIRSASPRMAIALLTLAPYNRVDGLDKEERGSHYGEAER